ncbi:MAG: DUF4369 domain-containing protein [Muribaculaceae bacterium]|nr:DUF4369 domain-containing protein [Muribaculaceae bacterium]
MTRNYKSRVLIMACLVLVVTVMCSCKKENKPFKVKVELQGLGSQQVKVVYSGADGGIVDYWAKCENNAFEIEGTCANPSLLMVYNRMNVPIIKLVVAGGDKLEVKGKILEPYELDVKGSEMAEQYNTFLVKHKTEYKSANSQALNTAIENYVKDNPKSVVSTVLVLLDYSPSDDTAIDKLLEKIDDSAKPESLVASYSLLKARSKEPATKITSLNIFEQSIGDFQMARIAGDKPSIIFFWDRDLGMNNRKQIFDELKMIDPSQAQVMDISIDIDSTGWYYATHQLDSSWKHYWVPGSMMNGEIVSLQVNTTPTIIVTDSLGNQKYRGADPIKARQTIESLYPKLS